MITRSDLSSLTQVGQRLRGIGSIDLKCQPVAVEDHLADQPETTASPILYTCSIPESRNASAFATSAQ